MILDTSAGQICFTYAVGTQRLLITEKQARFEGQGEEHILSFENGVWACDCATYRAFRDLPGGGWCQHTVKLNLALHTLAGGILPEHPIAASVRIPGVT